MTTEPPAGTLIGAWVQIPALYEVVNGKVEVVVPSFILIVWRRPVESQSAVYR